MQENESAAGQRRADILTWSAGNEKPLFLLTFPCFEVFVFGSYTLLTLHVRKGAIPVWFGADLLVVL